MKRLVMTLALTCLFSVSTMAGDIPNVDSTKPTPPVPILATTVTLPGDMPTVDSPQQISDAALSALLTVLGWLVV